MTLWVKSWQAGMLEASNDDEPTVLSSCGESRGLLAFHQLRVFAFNAAKKRIWADLNSREGVGDRIRSNSPRKTQPPHREGPNEERLAEIIVFSPCRSWRTFALVKAHSVQFSLT